MISQDFLTEIEHDILLTAYSGRSQGDLVQVMPGLWPSQDDYRKALAGLVHRDLLGWAGDNVYVLTEEGEKTAAVLMTDVAA